MRFFAWPDDKIDNYRIKSTTPEYSPVFETPVQQPPAAAHGLKRALRSCFSVLKDVRVDLSGTEILVAEKLLHGANVRALPQEVCRKRMP